jgi:hypothetical protein
MKKFVFWSVVVVLIGLVIFSLIYPENKRTRIFGGTMEINVEPGQKIMMATFKDNNLFYMTEPMDSGYVPKVKILREKSNRGILESTVKFIESK